MSTWTELFFWTKSLLTEVFRIFDVEIFAGLTFKVLIIGVLMISFSIGIIKFFISNTHSDPGIGNYAGDATGLRPSRKR